MPAHQKRLARVPVADERPNAHLVVVEPHEFVRGVGVVVGIGEPQHDRRPVQDALEHLGDGDRAAAAGEIRLGAERRLEGLERGTGVGIVGIHHHWLPHPQIADLDARTIDRVNPRTGRIVARLRVGGLPIRLGTGFGSVWVRDDSGRVLRIKPHR